jgi:hypothetical protein
MFEKEEHSSHPIIRRLLAYWIFTYGCVRLVSGVTNGRVLGALSYFIEAFCFEYELFAGATLHVKKVRFVSICSVALGMMVLGM